jgi:hypothetical protein
MITVSAYDTHVERLTEKVQRVHRVFTEAGIPYRVIGGLAVYFQVVERDPDSARVTRDIDIAVDRGELQRIKEAGERNGFRYRHVAGVDMLLDAAEPRAASAVHLVFVGEKVRPEYVEPVPAFSQPTVTVEGVLLAPVADLVRMKLTSFRDKDRVHVRDLDSVRLITPEIEASLPDVLRARLAEVRATE